MIVIVPYRPDNGHRDTLWNFLKTHYWAHDEVVVGEHVGGPFNRSKAINQAANRDWDVAVIADADTWVPRFQLDSAITIAKMTNRLTAAFSMVGELTPGCTQTILACQSLDAPLSMQKIRTRALEVQSSMLVVTRKLWDQTGGFDERFAGWGGEDNAFWHAATLHSGEPQRIPGYAYHLWHPEAQGKRQGITYRRNNSLWNRYARATQVEELP